MNRMVCSDSACSCHTAQTTHCNNCADPFAEEQNETEDSAACAYCDCHKTTDSEDWENGFRNKWEGGNAEFSGLAISSEAMRAILTDIRETRTAARASALREALGMVEEELDYEEYKASDPENIAFEVMGLSFESGMDAFFKGAEFAAEAIKQKLIKRLHS